MEALNASGDELHPFVKFQIIQYASIYETVIVNLLWGKFKEHPEVLRLQTHKSYKPLNALGSLTTLEYDGEKLYTCVYKESKTPRNSIPFHEKVDCAVRIGFVEECYAEDIKCIYTLRNLAHLETEANKQIEVEIEQSKLGYWRITPFLERVTKFVDEIK